MKTELSKKKNFILSFHPSYIDICMRAIENATLLNNHSQLLFNRSKCSKVQINLGDLKNLIISRSITIIFIG